MPKIRVDCTAQVFCEVTVTAAQLRQLEAEEIELSDIMDESVPYDALRSDGRFDFESWEPVASKKRKAKP